MPPAGFTEQMLLLDRLSKTVVAAESVGSSVDNDCSIQKQSNCSKMCFDCRNAKYAKNIFWGQLENNALVQKVVGSSWNRSRQILYLLRVGAREL